MEVKKIVWFVLETAVFVVIFAFWQIKDTIIPHTKIGFICGDSSFSLPYKTASIPVEWLYITLYVVPALIWVIDLSIEFINERKECKKRFVTTTLRCLKWFIYYYVVFMTLTILMTLLKNLVGAPRPIFFQICRPDLAQNCTTGAYVSSDYKCTNPIANEYLLFEITRSFPSGHAMSSVYITFYFMTYLQTRFSKFPVVLIAVHLMCLVWVVICCVSRITEHYHHVGDVIAGIILALPFVFYACRVLCNNFRTSILKVVTCRG